MKEQKFARLLYRALIRLHPPGFRRRFADEMLWIFDVSSREGQTAFLLCDGARSALLQRGRLDWQEEAASAFGQEVQTSKLTWARIGIAGEELSWIGTFHPDQVAGLIYLEAVDSYSFYDPEQTDMVMDMVDVRHEIDAFQAGEPLSAAVLDRIRDTAAALSRSSGRMAFNVSASGSGGDPMLPAIGLAVKFGQERFTTVHVPMLAVMACPHDFSELVQRNAKAAAFLKAQDQARCTQQISFLKSTNAAAHIVVVPNADHQIVRTNEADLVRAMNAFLAKLP